MHSSSLQLPHAEKQTIFSGCQCHIWAVEGKGRISIYTFIHIRLCLIALTHLVVASYTEDDYGVVQKVYSFF